MYETQLSIVIVNYNVKYFLQQCLYSVRAATQGLETDIYVVDNHSTDQSVEYLRPLFPEVTFIENTENVGFAKANNQALRICKGEYVLILNPDTVIGEESLRSLYFFMEDHPEAGALGLKMINGNGIFLAESKRSFPTPWVSFCKLFGLSKLFPNSPKYASYALPYLSPDEQHEVDVLCGAFMLMRHEALDKIGLLDEDFFMYGEDIDLSYRFIQGGYKNFYIPERMLHYKGESTQKLSYRFLQRFYGAMLIFYRKHYAQSSPLLNGAVKAAVMIRAGLASLSNIKGKRSATPRHRRILVVCRKESLEETKKTIVQKLPTCEHINLWDLNEERITAAICRKNQMKRFTDIVFVYPDTRFEQMFLLMDLMPNKQMTYHIFHREHNLFVSPGK